MSQTITQHNTRVNWRCGFDFKATNRRSKMTSTIPPSSACNYRRKCCSVFKIDECRNVQWRRWSLVTKKIKLTVKVNFYWTNNKFPSHIFKKKNCPQNDWKFLKRTNGTCEHCKNFVKVTKTHISTNYTGQNRNKFLHLNYLQT